MVKLFTKQELKITKYNLIEHHGYTEHEARDEIEGMIEVAENSHAQMLDERSRKEQKEKRYKKGRPIQLYKSQIKVSKEN